MKLQDHMHRINGWHNKYCAIMNRYCRLNHTVDSPAPEILFTCASGRYLGRYLLKEHECEYPLPWAIVDKHNYEETVAHEVCHAYQKKIMPESTWHGDLFLYLLRHVCAFPKAMTKAEHVNLRQHLQVASLGKILRVELELKPIMGVVIRPKRKKGIRS